MARTIEHRILLGFGLIVIILISIGYFAYENVRGLAELNKKTLSVYEIIAANQDVFISARDIESGGRGYMLTGEGDYLEPYYSAINRYPDQISILKKLTESDPQVNAKVDSLTILLEARKNITANYIRTRQEKGLDSAVAALKKGLGKRNTQQILSISVGIRKIQGEYLQRLLRKNYENLRESIRILIMLISVIIVTLILVYVLFRRDISGRIRAEKELQELNRSLEEKVEQRTEDLKRSFEDTEAKVKFRNLELEKLNRELQNRIAELEKRG